MFINKFNAIAIRDYYPSNNNPGNSIWVYEQVLELMNHDINSFVISPTPYIPNLLRKYKRFYLYPQSSKIIENYKGTFVIRPPYLKIPIRIFSYLSLFLQKKIILKYSKDLNPQIIHAHFGRNGVASIPLKRKLNIPLITYFYGEDVGIGEHAKFLQNYYKELIKYGDLFLALSEDMKKDLIHIGFPEEKIYVHHLGINISLFKKEQFIYKKQNEKIIICSVGRFHKNKGGQDTIHAFTLLIKDLDNIELRIIGDGPYIDCLKKLCIINKIQDKVIFINNFKSLDPRGVVLNEIRKSDIFIFTPFMDKKGIKTGTPVVLMEAQALNIPCISTNYAGISEVLNFGKSGILVEQRNINQIYNSLKLLCIDEDKRIEYGIKGREYVVKEFNQKTQMDKLAYIYKSEMIKSQI